MGALLTAARPRPRRLQSSLLRSTAATALATALLALLLVAPPTATAGTGPGAAPDAAGSRVVLARSPGPGADFPQLPAHCQSVDKQLPFTPCQITDFGKHRPTVVAWGDSHAWMYQAPMTRAANAEHVNLVLAVAGGCPPAIPKPHVQGEFYTQCEQRDRLVYRWVKQQVQDGVDLKLVLGGFWSGYRWGYERTHDPEHPRTKEYSQYDRELIDLAHDGTRPLFRRLGRLHVPTDVIGQAATVPPHPGSCPAGRDPYQCDLPRRRAMHDEAANRAWLHRMMANLSGQPRLIDATPAYCDARTCHAHVRGVNTWYDAIHLGLHLTRMLTRYFLPSFEGL